MRNLLKKLFYEQTPALFSQLREELADWRALYLFRRPMILILIGYGALILLLNHFGFLNRPSSQDPSHWIGQNVDLTGVVISQPDPRPINCVYVLEAETIRPIGTDETQSASGKIQIQISKNSFPLLLPGDRVNVIGRLQNPKPARLPGTFDYAAYLKSKQIYSLLYSGGTHVKNLGPTHSHLLLRWGWLTQQRAVSVFNKYLQAPEAAVLAGLAVGRRPRFFPEIKKIFVESGTMHILVASGSNVAFVVALWFLLARILFRLPRWGCLISALPFVWAYVLLAGADAPIVRAGFMITVGILSYLLAREDRPYNALCVAALLMLLKDPSFIFDVGFQMSFITVFGMVYFLPHIDSWFTNLHFFWLWLLRLIAATLTAQIWIYPITASVFKQIYPIGFLSNIVVLPMAEIGLAMGLVLVVLDFFKLCGSFFQFIAQHYLALLIKTVQFFAEHGGSGIWVKPPHPIWILGFYLACFCVVGLKRSTVCRVSLVTSLFLMTIGFFIRHPVFSQNHKLTLTWIDTGRQLCVLIQTPHEKNILITPAFTDRFDPVNRVVMPFLNEKSVRRIRAVMVVESNTKNGTLDSLLRAITVDQTLSSSTFKVGQIFSVDGVNIEKLSGDAFLIQHHNSTLIISTLLSLDIQKKWLREKNGDIEIIQTRFSEKILWDQEFVRRGKPKFIIETSSKPSFPPWPQVNLIEPHRIGFWTWKENEELNSSPQLFNTIPSISLKEGS